jgi:hypothetical protein
MSELSSASEDMPELPDGDWSVHDATARTLYRIAYLRRVQMVHLRPYLDELRQKPLSGVAKALYDWVIDENLIPYLYGGKNFLEKAEDRRGKSVWVIPGAELPEDEVELPSPDTIRKILLGLLSDDTEPVLSAPDSKINLFVQEIVDAYLDLPYPGPDIRKPCGFCGKQQWIAYPNGQGAFCGFCHPKFDSQAEE